MRFSLDRYFDNAATTPVDPHVRRAMEPFLGEACGNAHSIHAWGTQARHAVESARSSIAELLGADNPEEIVFTSGATESNNWVLRSFDRAWISPFEHSSIREPALRLGHGILGNAGLDLEPPTSAADLVSVMLVNNEIGSIFDLAGPATWAPALHSDLTQAVVKLHIDLRVLPIQLASFSGHKFYGPKGVGGLFIRQGAFVEPLLLGGEHENGLRAGTLNVPAIVGIGEAARIARDRRESDLAHAERLRNVVLEGLAGISDCALNGGARVSPFILSISFLGVQGETLVLEADRAGYAISSGAACSSRSTEPSHVLTALGCEPAWLQGTLRISFGRSNTVEAAAGLARVLRDAVGTLRSLRV